MAEKKKQNNKEAENEAREKAKAPDTTKDTSKEMREKEVSSGKKRSAKRSKQSKEKEYQEKFLRLYSEFDNYRKRTIKERIELSKTASEELILELLPVLDDFERAMKSNEESKDCEAIKDGINLIYNKFRSTLEKKGLKPIEAIGKEFDTDFHEAISQTPAPSDDLKGKIVDVIEKGYQLNDKVIRFSKVVIGQ